jgi:ABC-2 type transport system permease protein
MKNQRSILFYVLILLAIVLINYAGSVFHFRKDLTEEKRYSLTSTTRDILRNLKEPVSIIVFLKGDFPTEFRSLANRTQEFLSLLKETAPAKINYQFIDPQDKVDDAKTWGDSLHNLGASPINISVQVKAGQENKIIYPYALLFYNGQIALVNLFPNSKKDVSAIELNNAEAMMEYEFTSNLDKLMNPERPKVAYALGNGEPANERTYDLTQLIKSNYVFGTYDLSVQKAIPAEINALLIVKPSTQFTDQEKLKIDQYVMNGGRVLWFIDNLFAEQDSLSFKSQLIAYDRNLNLQDLLFTYGVRINPDLIMDLQCDYLPFAVGGTASSPQYEFLKWNYYPLFETRSNHIINKNIGLISGKFVNSIDTVEANGITKTYLLQSSANSRTISTPALISPNENRNSPEDALFKMHDIPAAVLLEGSFTSMFTGRIGQAAKDSLKQFGGFKDHSNSDNKMVVVADGDIVLNDYSTRQGPLPMGMNLYTVGSQYEYQFANRDFLLNCLEYVTSKSNIIKTRNKEIVLRLLNAKKVENEKTKWQLINIAIPVLLIIFIGLIFQQIRRRRYASV